MMHQHVFHGGEDAATASAVEYGSLLEMNVPR